VDTPVRVAETPKRVEEWSLVLTAMGIPHAIRQEEARFLVLVERADLGRADSALGAYERETPTTSVALRGPAPYPWMSGATVGLLLLGAFAITGPSASRSAWFQHGAAVAGRIVWDEPWRAVTALTLHSDLGHVLGNALATAVLLGPLAQRVGVGAALGLSLLAGATGNVLSALVHPAEHASVGASTATFGIVGALAALRLVSPATPAPTPRRRLAVISAAVLLLAMLGTAPDADVIAHALGLACGAALGALAGVLIRRPPALAVQGLVALLSAAAVLGAWSLAL
jgi:membrane associated rhomboid family serine protease